jgi:hypothetical protein
MAASRLVQQFAIVGMRDMFRTGAEDISYTPKVGGAAVALCALVDRETPIDAAADQRHSWLELRARATVSATVDATYGGIALASANDLENFIGTNFSIALQEGGTPQAGWLVAGISGGPGTWELSLVLRERIETGKGRAR